MGRPRTSAKVLELRNAHKKNPQRARGEEPKPAGAFPKSAPRHLKPEVKKTWREIAKAVPPGVLTSADTLIVEVAAHLLHEFRITAGMMQAQRMVRMTQIFGRLGLDPAGRAGLTLPKAKESNPFDDV